MSTATENNRASASARPQPGDGSYLSPPQPGDGNYLTQQTQRFFHGHRGGLNGYGRMEANSRQGNGEGSSSGRGLGSRGRTNTGHGAPARNPGRPESEAQGKRGVSAASKGSDSTSTTPLVIDQPASHPQVVLNSTIIPHAEAASRAKSNHYGNNGAAVQTGHAASTGNGAAALQGESSRSRRNQSRSEQGRARNQSQAIAKLNPTAPSFTLPAASLSQLTPDTTPSLNSLSITATSSRASSVDGKARSEGPSRRGNARKKGPNSGVAAAPPAVTAIANGGRAANSADAQLSRKPGTDPKTPAQVSSRRAAFDKQTKLTTSDSLSRSLDGVSPSREADKSDDKKAVPTRQGKRAAREEKDDLVSRLTRGLGRKPFLECPICFNSITPAQPIFSCLPPTFPPDPSTFDPNGEPPANYYQACYTPFHLSCIRDWADRSLADETEKIRANNLEEVGGGAKRAEWRCPGCQKRREDRVGMYKCFCGRLTQPATNGSAPHSCSEPCSRARATCSHPCPLPCHPGPCPPCQVALIVPCPSHHSSLTVKCAASSANLAGQSGGTGMRAVCDEICGKERGCGNLAHVCEMLCHFGNCAPCKESESVKCYCGSESRIEPCGWNRDHSKQCAKLPESGTEVHWVGRYACERVCGEKFDCGIHSCEDKCHPHSLSPLPCPTSPSLISSCPCGQTPLTSLPEPARTRCTDPIPTCTLACPRSRPCGHPCPLKCHSGECPPCHEEVVRPCRCGESLLVVRCEVFSRAKLNGGEEGLEEELRCERVCRALRNCGRHECARICCPLSYKAKSSRIKKKAEDHHPLSRQPSGDELHNCPLTCGKLLSCGLHTCQRKDHRGACGRCLEASYEELVCHCGETVVYPPVACGTTISCLFPCARPPPSCGHPKSPHACHESALCPPCPYLTNKPCACGKDPAVKNVRCSQSVVSCGQICGSLLSCGFHRCERSCHKPAQPGHTGDTAGGGCGDCHQVCGKPKKVCRHPCTAACHAPARCPEGDPCQAIIDQKCACGNLSVRTTCGATANATDGGAGGETQSRETVQLKCNSECAVKQRNARLAEALGIKVEGRGEVDWPQELKSFGTANYGFVKMVEGALGDFIKGGKQSVVLPHMPSAKRAFVLSLAQVYRIGTELVDQEPNRSVLIRRRVDTRLPQPLLSAAIQPAQKPSLGGLANLRAVNTPSTTSVVSGGANRSGPTASGWGKASNPTLASAVKGWGNGVPTPIDRSAVPSPAGSGSRTPAEKVSRPVTPVAPVLQQGSNMPNGNAGFVRGREVVGEVGKVEDTDDWDIDT